MNDYFVNILRETSDKTKFESIPIIQTIVSFAQVARSKGLLSLEAEIAESDSFLLKEGLELVIDGVDPEIVQTVMENYILTANKKDKDLFNKILIMQGVLRIQKGDHPKFIAKVLLSYLGEDIQRSARNYFNELNEEKGERQQFIYEYLKKIKGKPAIVESDELFALLPDRPAAISQIMSEVGNEVFASALSCAAGELQAGILFGMSNRNMEDIIERLYSLWMNNDDVKERCVESQQIIRRELEAMERRGEIILKF